jgi:DNA modification methylase
MMDLLNGQTHYVHHGDCVEYMAAMPSAYVDFVCFSPPFPGLYAYSSAAADIGNTENLRTDAKLHLSFFYRQLARIVKPGRVIVVHVMQIPRMKRSGEVGLFDFRGMNIRLGERAGLVFEYDWCIRKNPQSQAIRTKSRELQFVGLERDRAKSRGALADYLLKFRAPGENAVHIEDEGQVSRNDWINWAECCWSDIRETDTLNIRGTKGEGDVKHICPLQLGVIDRLVRLYSNEGEIVFSPFAGIGSEGYQSLYRGRRFLGCELKPEYHAKCLENLQDALERRRASEQLPLFGGPEDESDGSDPEQETATVSAGANSDLDDI